MKICVLTKYYGKDYTGATTSTYNLIEKWIEWGVDVTVITLKIVGKTNLGAKINVCNNLKDLLLELKKLNGHFFIGYSDDHLGFFFRRTSMEYVHTYHGNWPQAMFHAGIEGIIKGIWFIPQYILTIKNAQTVGCVSFFSTKFVKRFNKHYQVIRNGVNIVPSCKKEVIKLKGNIKLIMVGGVDRRKYSSLQDVLGKMDKEVRDSIVIDIYGKIYDDQLMGLLSSLQNVHFVGFKENIPYENYDFLLSTSTAENLSIASLEAVCCGIPTIGFETGGMSEAINNNNGILLENGNVVQMEKLLTRIVKKGTRIKFNNEETIEEFSWSMSAKKYLNEFKLLTKRKEG